MPVQRLHAVSHIDLFGARHIRDATKTRLRQIGGYLRGERED